MIIGLIAAILIIAAIVWQRFYLIRQKEKIRQIENVDSLTGVLSRAGFNNKVEELLKKNPDMPYMLSFNNIKDLKYINDSLGWEAGDELLRFWTERSLEILSDDEAMGRYEGDRFVVLRTMKGQEGILEDDKYVFTPLRNYFIDRGKDIKVRISSGVYILTPEDYKNINVDKMIDCARIAEKRVHNGIKDGFAFYNRKQLEKGKRSAGLAGRLTTAIESGEIRVWYQPQVDYKSRKIIGAEALCRWISPKDGFISPGEFIPALEDAGFIYDLDCFVWESVCRDLQRWNALDKHLCVSVNLSRFDIVKNPGVADYIKSLTDKYNISPDQIRVEVTESAYVENTDMIHKTTGKLRDYGFQVEMDDFGSGYSSLNMLKEVKVDRIKLDLRFLTGSGDRNMGQIIISYMIQMINALNISLIAEGVETTEQADFLGNLGCSEMQGYYFYKPMPVDEFEKLQ